MRTYPTMSGEDVEQVIEAHAIILFVIGAIFPFAEHSQPHCRVHKI